MPVAWRLSQRSSFIYAATAELAVDLLPRMGIDVTKVDASDTEAVKSAICNKTKLIYIETPCNPLLRLTDFAALAEIAHAAGAKLAADSTFATPKATRPIHLGADFVIHSLTKYIGGHGDALGGAVLGFASDLEQMRKMVAIRTGGVISPFNAWLIMRGMATLPIRMRVHEENAMQIAKFLEAHPKVTRVVYPGLPSRVLADRLSIIHNAVSLGHHHSLIFYLLTSDMIPTRFI